MTAWGWLKSVTKVAEGTKPTTDPATRLTIVDEDLFKELGAREMARRSREQGIGGRGRRRI